MTAWTVPIWDCSCRQQLGWCLFGTVHVDDSLDGAYLGLFMYRLLGWCLFGTVHVDDSLDSAYLGPFM